MAHIEEARIRKRVPFVNIDTGSTSETKTSSLPRNTTTFADLKLVEPILRALQAEGYTAPTPIQAQTIPYLLEGRDVLGCARTGTGKTAAFALPILDRFAQAPRPPRPGIRALVLTPTRELALQVMESFVTYGKNLRVTAAAIFGGVGQGPQVQAVRRGTDVIVATPGRLLDLMQQGHVKLDMVEVLVLDEADRMLDMGFIQPIRRILAALPRKRQNLLFSATMPTEIASLAAGILVNPAKIAVDPVSSSAEKVTQKVLFVDKGQKQALLREVLKDPATARVLVFTRTKHGANRCAQQLERTGINAAAIHGNKTQGARQKALEGFKNGSVRVLVATDIAARGIDVDNVTHVINLDIPNEPESYVHRIGRTGRAGAGGIALSFCDGEERTYLRQIERLTGHKIEVMSGHPFAGNARMADHAPDTYEAPRPRHDSRPRHEHRPRHEAQPAHAEHRPRHEAPAAHTEHRPSHAPTETRPAQAPAANQGGAPSFGRGMRRVVGRR
jgi:ATP-dependent RNA helicase RhlE